MFKDRRTGQSPKDGNDWYKKTGDFVNYIKIKEGNILDVGCGAGEHSKQIAKYPKRKVFALDIVIKNAVTLKLLPNVHLVEGSVMNIPFKNSVFDAVYSNHSLEHTFGPIYALIECNRVLRQDGCLYLAVPPHTDYVSPGHISMGWNIGQLYYILGVLGFDVKNGQFKKESHSIRCIVKKIKHIGVSNLGSIKFDTLFSTYPTKDSLSHNGIVRYKGNINKLNWRA